MNTYSKYMPNVFLAKCEEKQIPGSVILLSTKYGKENECIVFNLIYEKDGFFYYSIVREDGFDSREWAKRRAEKLNNASANATKKSNEYYQASHEGKDFLALAEPIKVGHHSEKRHRALIERNWNRMGKSVEYADKASGYDQRAEYWEKKGEAINLSMPDCLEYFEFLLEKAQKEHEDLKSGKTERSHSFSLTYAKKHLNEVSKKLEIAKKLWA